MAFFAKKGFLGGDHLLSVLVTCSLEERVRRRLGRGSNGETAEEQKLTVEEATELVTVRDKEDQERMKALYAVDIFDPANYDIVFPTDGMSGDQQTKAFYRLLKEKGFYLKIYPQIS